MVIVVEVIRQNVFSHAIVIVIGVGSDFKASMYNLNNRK